MTGSPATGAAPYSEFVAGCRAERATFKFWESLLNTRKIVSVWAAAMSDAMANLLQFSYASIPNLLIDQRRSEQLPVVGDHVEQGAHINVGEREVRVGTGHVIEPKFGRSTGSRPSAPPCLAIALRTRNRERHRGQTARDRSSSS
jgi:hypothetical protein